MYVWAQDHQLLARMRFLVDVLGPCLVVILRFAASPCAVVLVIPAVVLLSLGCMYWHGFAMERDVFKFQ